MPIRPPALDDRGYDDLVAELVARIPAHTPEWTHVAPGDPGRTLIELFAWLGDTLLYRANLIPERQRLAFLRLLGHPLLPARAAGGLVALSLEDRETTAAVQVPAHSPIDRPLPFETLHEATVFPVTARCYCKRRLDDRELDAFRDLLPDLRDLHGLDGEPVAYATTAVFPEGRAEAGGFDLIGRTVDRSLWIALFAAAPAQVEAVRGTLGAGPDGRRRVLNVGLAPALEVPALFEDIGVRARMPHVWEIATGRDRGDELDYLTLETLADDTLGLARAGVQRLLLPGADDIGAPPNDVRRAVDAGVAQRPPRIDDPVLAARLVTWLRLRPDAGARIEALRLSWAGVNAVGIDQRRTVAGRVVGVGNGASDQTADLGEPSVEAASLELQVEEEGLGWRTWRQVPDLALASRDDAVYVLDGEAGQVRFGDGVRGRVPGAGRAIRIARMRAGGGAHGNLPAGSVSALAGLGPGREAPPVRVAVWQPLAFAGGADAETVAEAERRIPARLRHRERAVTESDFRELAARAPGVAVGRVEVMPRFKPQQRRFGVPGVVSVMVLPKRDGHEGPNPRPDRPFLETVHAWLDPRRVLGTELYTIGCEYVPLGVSVAVEVRDGHARDAVLNAVREALRAHLWPLAPGGVDGSGWALGRPVGDRELEVVTARVPGVAAVAPVKLFARPASGAWRQLPRDGLDRASLPLLAWQLPELLALAVVDGTVAPDALQAPAGPADADGAIPVPVVPRVC